MTIPTAYRGYALQITEQDVRDRAVSMQMTASAGVVGFGVVRQCDPTWPAYLDAVAAYMIGHRQEQIDRYIAQKAAA